MDLHKQTCFRRPLDIVDVMFVATKDPMRENEWAEMYRRYMEAHQPDSIQSSLKAQAGVFHKNAQRLMAFGVNDAQIVHCIGTGLENFINCQEKRGTRGATTPYSPINIWHYVSRLVPQDGHSYIWDRRLCKQSCLLQCKAPSSTVFRSWYDCVGTAQNMGTCSTSALLPQVVGCARKCGSEADQSDTGHHCAEHHLGSIEPDRNKACQSGCDHVLCCCKSKLVNQGVTMFCAAANHDIEFPRCALLPSLDTLHATLVSAL
eukprot:1143858-Pelagomonas_calceolata.AAC.4